MSPLAPTSRRGITLLEVLIAIGILAIGLSSVVAILPAAKSQGTRAVVYDRASALAANLLADAATFGLLREGALSATSGPLAIVDPAAPAGAYNPLVAPPLNLPSTLQVALRNAGIFSTSLSGTSPAGYHKLFTEGRDDVLLGAPPTPDDLPTHLIVDGGRAYEGRMTALLAIRPPTPPSLHGTLSAVVFHNRDLSQPIVTGTLSGVELTLDAIPDGRTFRDLVKPGVVIYDGTRFHQLTSAAVHEVDGKISAFVTLSNPAPYGSEIRLFPDSVGLAERPYTPEVNGAFLR